MFKMTTLNRRIALLTGASLAALGMATPALADPRYPGLAPHDGVADGTYAGINETAPPYVDTIDICLIPTAVNCFVGVKQTGAGNQTATVNSVATGQIEQWAPFAPTTVDFNIIVGAGDSAEIGAVAIATAGGDAAASLNTAISQTASGGSADQFLSVTNDGALLIDALAVATGGTWAIADASSTTASTNIIGRPAATPSIPSPTTGR